MRRIGVFMPGVAGDPESEVRKAGINLVKFVNGQDADSPTGPHVAAGSYLRGDRHRQRADDNSDILWQNTDGRPAIWLMNGTDVVSAGNVGLNPGPSWDIIRLTLSRTAKGNLIGGSKVPATSLVLVAEPIISSCPTA